MLQLDRSLLRIATDEVEKNVFRACEIHYRM